MHCIVLYCTILYNHILSLVALVSRTGSVCPSVCRPSDLSTRVTATTSPGTIFGRNNENRVVTACVCVCTSPTGTASITTTHRRPLLRSKPFTVITVTHSRLSLSIFAKKKLSNGKCTEEGNTLRGIPFPRPIRRSCKGSNLSSDTHPLLSPSDEPCAPTTLLNRDSLYHDRSAIATKNLTRTSPSEETLTSVKRRNAMTSSRSARD